MVRKGTVSQDFTFEFFAFLRSSNGLNDIDRDSAMNMSRVSQRYSQESLSHLRFDQVMFNVLMQLL